MCELNKRFFVVLFFFLATSSQAEVSSKDIIKLKKIVYYPSFQINASVVPLQQSNLSSQMAGTYQDVLVEVGEEVPKNHTLAKLDCTLHELTLKLAKKSIQKINSQMELFDKTLNRQLHLLKTNNISQNAVDETLSQAKIAQISLAEQMIRIKSLTYTQTLCDIKAPFAGTIVKKIAQAGQAVSPGVTSFVILNKNKVEIIAKVPQHMVNDLQKATSFIFKSENTNYPVQLSSSIPLYEKNRTREFRFKSKEKLIAGVNGSITWKSTIPYLPEKHLKHYKDSFGLFIVKNNKIEFLSLANVQEGRATPLKSLPKNIDVYVKNTDSFTVGDTLQQ